MNSTGKRQSGPGVPPSPPARLRWTISVCCAALGAGVMLLAPAGAELSHLILRFLTAAAVTLTAPALIAVACRRPLYCVGSTRQRPPAQMPTRHLCAEAPTVVVHYLKGFRSYGVECDRDRWAWCGERCGSMAIDRQQVTCMACLAASGRATDV